jgi:hypothetical protein
MKVITTVEYTDEEKALKFIAEKSLKHVTKNFNKIGNIGEVGVGNLVHIPTLIDGQLKDKMYKEEELPLHEIKICIGYAMASRTAKLHRLFYEGPYDPNENPFNVVMVKAIKEIKQFYGWQPTDYHYGDYLRVVDVQCLDEAPGYAINLEGNAIPAIEGEK